MLSGCLGLMLLGCLCVGWYCCRVCCVVPELAGFLWGWYNIDSGVSGWVRCAGLPISYMFRLGVAFRVGFLVLFLVPVWWVCVDVCVGGGFMLGIRDLFGFCCVVGVSFSCWWVFLFCGWY